MDGWVGERERERERRAPRQYNFWSLEPFLCKYVSIYMTDLAECSDHKNLEM